MPKLADDVIKHQLSATFWRQIKRRLPGNFLLRMAILALISLSSSSSSSINDNWLEEQNYNSTQANCVCVWKRRPLALVHLHR